MDALVTSTKWMGMNLQHKMMFFRLWKNFSSILAMEYLRNRQDFRLCRADFQIAWCVWVVMFVKQYIVLQEMLSDQYWNKLNIMQPVPQGTGTWNRDFFLFQNYLAAKTMNRFIIKRAWNIILYRNLCLITMFSKFLLIN